MNRIYSVSVLLVSLAGLGYAIYALHLGKMAEAAGAFTTAMALWVPAPKRGAEVPPDMDLTTPKPTITRLPGVTLLVLSGLFAMACASTLPQQRALAALHHQALLKCSAAPGRCGQLLPCSSSLRAAQWAWQRVQRLQADLPTDPPGSVAPVDLGPAPADVVLAQAGALLAEHDARRVCSGVGVQ